MTRSDTGGGRRYAGRRDNDASGGDEASGYLFISDDQPWPPSLDQVLVDGRLPYSWLTYDPVAGRGRRSGPAEAPAEPVWVDVTGLEVSAGRGHLRGVRAEPVPVLPALPHLLRAGPRQRLRQAGQAVGGGPQLGHVADHRQHRAHAAHLGRRSRRRARKLLAFVDNRQDASLQAGHFNDFVQVTQLRGALYRALEKAPGRA